MYLTLWLNAILCIMNFEKQGIQPSKSWTEVKQENDGRGTKKGRKTKKLFDFQPLFRKWARAPPPNRFLGEDRESGQSSDGFAFDLLLYETRTKTDTASLAQVE